MTAAAASDFTFARLFSVRQTKIRRTLGPLVKCTLCAKPEDVSTYEIAQVKCHYAVNKRE